MTPPPPPPPPSHNRVHRDRRPGCRDVAAGWRCDVSANGPRGGFGVVGLGDPGSPSQKRKRPDLCAEHGHPGCTYNSWLHKTWCLCGEVVRDGDTAVQCVSCCGGPLEETRCICGDWPSECGCEVAA